MADEYIRRKDAAKLLGYIFGVPVLRRSWPRSRHGRNGGRHEILF